MLEPLLSQQRKGIFKSCFPPSVFAEVVAEKVCHFCILLRPKENDIHNNIIVSGLQHCDRTTLLKVGANTVKSICVFIFHMQKAWLFCLPVQSPNNCLLFQCEIKYSCIQRIIVSLKRCLGNLTKRKRTNMFS